MTSMLLLASHPEGSRNTPLVASCYGNRNKHWPDGPLGSYAESEMQSTDHCLSFFKGKQYSALCSQSNYICSHIVHQCPIPSMTRACRDSR